MSKYENSVKTEYKLRTADDSSVQTFDCHELHVILLQCETIGKKDPRTDVVRILTY